MLGKTKSNLSKLIALFIGLTVLLSACNIPTQQVTNPDELVEKALQTLAWQSTKQALETMSSQLTQPVVEQPTQTAIIQVVTATSMAPTQTPFVQVVTATPNPPTQTPIIQVVTATPKPPVVYPTVAITPVPCNRAKFIQDVTVPDYTYMAPGSAFTKTWRVRNDGTCTWTPEYDLVFVSGSAMDGVAVTPLTGNVAPGQTVDLSVNMKAPTAAGDYTGYWMLRNQYDARFGVGDDARVSLWVKIKVKTYTMFYNMADKVCDAKWSTTYKTLACPGDETNITDGYAIKKTNAKREDGAVENELSLITRPDSTLTGHIEGVYPKFLVQKGDIFKATINCEYNSPACDIKFKLKYQIGDAAMVELAVWHEVYEGKFRQVSVDLSELAGKEVKLVLIVKNNNNTATDNRAMWILPSIWR